MPSGIGCEKEQPTAKFLELHTTKPSLITANFLATHPPTRIPFYQHIRAYPDNSQTTLLHAL